MLKFNNNHIFTGYLKQLLSSVNLPCCKIYTREFMQHVIDTGKEDPRVVDSYGVVSSSRPIMDVNYLKNNKICNFYYDMQKGTSNWRTISEYHYDKDKDTNWLTRKLKSLGPVYDTTTHEYLGDFLRFLRDYYDINLMSLYNCFTNNICHNIDFNYVINDSNVSVSSSVEKKTIIFDSTDASYKIYALPVKLFSEYTIAIDCNQGIELFCGFYKNSLDWSNKAKNLFSMTYKKIPKTFFNQPFIYDRLTHNYWTRERELVEDAQGRKAIEKTDAETEIISRYDIINREQDLKLFIKVPSTCKSSITILEGNFSSYNDYLYTPIAQNTSNNSTKNICWSYRSNHSILNFDNKTDINNGIFKPISKLQLLAFNTYESYPFADRLIEYLTGSAILPIDGIKDNIKRAQKVMSNNNHYFKIDGLWEPKMQKIAYDYIVNAGPIKYDEATEKLIDERRGVHNTIGHNAKSTLYDILGYIDKDIEKYYTSWKVEKDENKKKVRAHNSIKNVDIYDGLYDI